MDPTRLRQILYQYGDIHRIYLVPENSYSGNPGRGRSSTFFHEGIDSATRLQLASLATNSPLHSIMTARHPLNCGCPVSYNRAPPVKLGTTLTSPAQSCRSSFEILQFKFNANKLVASVANSSLRGGLNLQGEVLAKKVANMLNGEQIANNNRTREQKLTMEISAAKRERDFYLKKVDQSKALKFMKERFLSPIVMFVELVRLLWIILGAVALCYN